MRLAMEYTALDSISIKYFPSDFQLRTCSEDELLAIISFLQGNFPGDWQGKLWEKYYSSQGKLRIISLYLEKRPVASAIAQTTSANVGILSMVAVDPDFRRQGLGEIVVSAALDFLKKAGQEKAVLCTDSFRFSALRFYLKLGFQPLILNQEQKACWRGVLKKIQKLEWIEAGSVFSTKAGML